jgi:hypothetical protein
MKQRLVRGLLLLLSVVGCGRLIGARFDELRPGPECEDCAGSGNTSGGGAGGRGQEGGVGGSNAGRGSGMGPAGEGGEGGAAAGRGGSSGGVAGSNGGAGGSSGGGTGDEGGMSGAGGDDGDPCTTNAECLDRHPAEAYICRKSQCVALQTNECSIVLPWKDALGYLRAESPLLVGGLTSGVPLQHEHPHVLNWELAFSEFNAATSEGLDGGKRPLILVTCDATEHRVIPAMKHLALDLGITGMLVSIQPKELLDAFDYTRDDAYKAADGKDVFFLSMSSATNALEILEDDGLVWHMLGSPRQHAETTAALVRRIEPHVQAQREARFELFGDDDPTAPRRLMLIAADTSLQTEIANVLTSGNADTPETNLVVNGELAILQNEFKQLQTQSELIHGQVDAEIVAEAIVAHKPHIVVAMATAEFSEIMMLVEADWVADGQIQPHYVLSPSLIGNVGLLNLMQTHQGYVPPLHEHTVGVNYAQSREYRALVLWAAYRARLLGMYGEMYGEGPLAPTLPNYENYYDAAYLLFYSYVAAGAASNDVSAEGLRDALTTRVISDHQSADTFEIGPLPILGALARLEHSSNVIRFYGTMGDPTYDRSTGIRQVPTSAWCFDVIDNVATVAVDALLYDRELRDFYDPPDGPPLCMDQY